MKTNGENSDATTSASTQQQQQQLADELADIDLNDPELAQAAAKIQKQFRGFKKGGGTAKKESDPPPQPAEGTKSSDNDEKKADEDELADIDLTDPELEKAAMKIQSTFKGFKTRRAPQN